MRISLIGSGNIGGILAFILLKNNCFKTVVMCDLNPHVEGKGLDIAHSAPIFGSDTNIITTCDVGDIKGSDVVVITAGFTRSPGMTREDLLTKNFDVIKTTAESIKKLCKPSTFVICVTNPLDIMTWVIMKYSGLPKNQVVGMAGTLDGARFEYFLAKKLNVSIEKVKALVLGGHGDSMVPSINNVSVSGIPIKSLIKMGMIKTQDLEEIIQKTKDAGAEIIKKGGASAYFSTASAIFEVIHAYLKDKKALICCSTLISNQYGIKECVIGVPCILGSNGVEKIIEVDLEAEEKESFKKSSDTIIKMSKEVGIL